MPVVASSSAPIGAPPPPASECPERGAATATVAVNGTRGRRGPGSASAPATSRAASTAANAVASPPTQSQPSSHSSLQACGNAPPGHSLPSNLAASPPPPAEFPDAHWHRTVDSLFGFRAEYNALKDKVQEYRVTAESKDGESRALKQDLAEKISETLALKQDLAKKVSETLALKQDLARRRRRTRGRRSSWSSRMIPGQSIALAPASSSSSRFVSSQAGHGNPGLEQTLTSARSQEDVMPEDHLHMEEQVGRRRWQEMEDAPEKEAGAVPDKDTLSIEVEQTPDGFIAAQQEVQDKVMSFDDLRDLNLHVRSAVAPVGAGRTNDPVNGTDQVEPQMQHAEQRQDESTRGGAMASPSVIAGPSTAPHRLPAPAAGLAPPRPGSSQRSTTPTYSPSRRQPPSARSPTPPPRLPYPPRPQFPAGSSNAAAAQDACTATPNVEQPQAGQPMLPTRRTASPGALAPPTKRAKLSRESKQAPFDYSLPSAFMALLDVPLSKALEDLEPRILPYPAPPCSSTDLDLTDGCLHEMFVALSTLGVSRDESGAIEKLANGWRFDSRRCLQIIFLLASRGSCLGGFLLGCAWLYDHHPKTFLRNLHLLVLPRTPGSPDAPTVQGWCMLNNLLMVSAQSRLTTLTASPTPMGNAALNRQTRASTAWFERSSNTWGTESTRMKSKGYQTLARGRTWTFSDGRDGIGLSGAGEDKVNMARNALRDSPRHQALACIIAHCYHEHLVRDMGLVDALSSLSGPALADASALARSVLAAGGSLAIRCCPTPGKRLDMHTLLVSMLSRLFFPRIPLDLVRRLVVRDVEAPLKEALLTGIEGGEPFDDTFMISADGSHDNRVSAASPQHLLLQALSPSADARQIASARWRAVLGTLAGVKGCGLVRTLAVCDFAGGQMGCIDAPPGVGTPGCHIALQLSLASAALSPPPFRHLALTFDSHPTFISLPPSLPLDALANGLYDVDSAWVFNLGEALDLILKRSVEASATADSIPTRLVVFSPVAPNDGLTKGGFDEGDRDGWAQLYASAGYTLPDIFYWVLPEYVDVTPVTLIQRGGLTLITGWNQGFTRSLLAEGGEALWVPRVLRAGEQAVSPSEAGGQSTTEPHVSSGYPGQMQGGRGEGALRGDKDEGEGLPVEWLMLQLETAEFDNIILFD
ncbi:hypothetical protein IAT38_000186 [Cryptococcus sp. DSM 104549]